MAGKKVAVLGAGFSGLTSAYFLLERGFSVEIFEKTKIPGGMIQTLENKYGVKAETAANGFLASALLEQVCKNAGIFLQTPLPTAKKRFIFFQKMQRWPLSFSESLAFAGLVFRFFFARRTVLPRPEQTIVQWARAQFGEIRGVAITQKLLSPALRGIYAGDVQRLSASLILGPVMKSRLKRGEFKGTVSPLGGMSVFMRKLSQHLLDHGVRFHFETKLSAQDLRAQGYQVVVATSGEEAHKQLPAIVPAMERLDVIRTTASFDADVKKIGGFGVLFADNQGFRALGALSNSEIFADASPGQHSESWIFAGAKDPEILKLSDSELQFLIVQERAQLLRDGRKPLSLEISRWPQGLPHYTVEMEKQLNKLQEKLPEIEKQGFYLVGNYLGVLGLSRILQRNFEVMQRVLAE
jgi:oxygen-dependent protoporphyrinogen oxidase